MAPLHRIAFTCLILAAGAARAFTLDAPGSAFGESVQVAGRGETARAERGGTLDDGRGTSDGLDLTRSIGARPSEAATLAPPVAVWDVAAGPPGDSALYSGAFSAGEGGASPDVVSLANGYLGTLGSAALAGFSEVDGCGYAQPLAAPGSCRPLGRSPR